MALSCYSQDAVDLTIDLANCYDLTRRPSEQLDDVAALEGVLRQHDVLRSDRADARDLQQIRTLRRAIRRIIEEPSPARALALLNEFLAAARLSPWIAQHPDGTREIFYAPPDPSLSCRVACDTGIGLARMMVEQAGRLKVCAAHPCRNVFVDATRNRSRRSCSRSCANRMNVAAHRARRRAGITAWADA